MTEEQLDEEMLLDLERRTAELPREIAPPESAWQRIVEQIAIDSRNKQTPAGTRHVWQMPIFLAAAGLVLVAASSITTAIVIGGRAEKAPSRTAAMQAPRSSAPATLAEFTARENDYIATVNALSQTIESAHVELAPETIVKLKESIRIIDDAIIEARRALAADPSNKALIDILSTSYDQKVDLLRRTAEMGQS
jgi:hypothetical protein